jgi:predicted phage terminase large subunit-like protein
MTPREVIIDQAYARLATDSYYEFVKQAFAVLEPETKYVDNWHVEYLCNTIQSMVERVGRHEPKKRNIIINIPPRAMKSVITTICIVPWAWIHFPHLKFIASSYSAALSLEHSSKARRIIESPWYKRHWGDRYQLQGDENQKSNYENTKMGRRTAVSTGGTVIGKGADIIIMDDPQDPKGARSEIDRQKTIEFFDNTLSTRLNDTVSGSFLLVQQRLHEKDLTGYLLSKDGEGEAKWQHICLPAELDTNIKPARLTEFYKDGLMFPVRFHPDFLADQRTRLGSRQYAGQYSQRPAKLGGNIIKGAWFRRFRHTDLPANFVVNFYSDTAYTEKSENDPSGIMAFTQINGNTYILGSSVFYKEFPEFIKHAQAYTEALGRSKQSRIWIEPKASGKSIVQVLKRIPGLNVIEATPPVGSKIERVNSITAQIEGGKVFIPFDDDMKYGGAWIEAFVAECEAFPSVKHDEQVDELAGILGDGIGRRGAFGYG